MPAILTVEDGISELLDRASTATHLEEGAALELYDQADIKKIKFAIQNMKTAPIL